MCCHIPSRVEIPIRKNIPIGLQPVFRKTELVICHPNLKAILLMIECRVTRTKHPPAQENS